MIAVEPGGGLRPPQVETPPARGPQGEQLPENVFGFLRRADMTRTVAAFQGMDPQRAVIVLPFLPQNQAGEILRGLSEDRRREIERLRTKELVCSPEMRYSVVVYHERELRQRLAPREHSAIIEPPRLSPEEYRTELRQRIGAFASTPPFSEQVPDDAFEFLNGVNQANVARLFTTAGADTTVALLPYLTQRQRDDILRRFTPEFRQNVERMARDPRYQQRIVQPDFINQEVARLRQELRVPLVPEEAFPTTEALLGAIQREEAQWQVLRRRRIDIPNLLEEDQYEGTNVREVMLRTMITQGASTQEIRDAFLEHIDAQLAGQNFQNDPSSTPPENLLRLNSINITIAQGEGECERTIQREQGIDIEQQEVIETRRQRAEDRIETARTYEERRMYDPNTPQPAPLDPIDPIAEYLKYARTQYAFLRVRNHNQQRENQFYQDLSDYSDIAILPSQQGQEPPLIPFRRGQNQYHDEPARLVGKHEIGLLNLERRLRPEVQRQITRLQEIYRQRDHGDDALLDRALGRYSSSSFESQGGFAYRFENDLMEHIYFPPGQTPQEAQRSNVEYTDLFQETVLPGEFVGNPIRAIDVVIEQLGDNEVMEEYVLYQEAFTRNAHANDTRTHRQQLLQIFRNRAGLAPEDDIQGRLALARQGVARVFRSNEPISQIERTLTERNRRAVECYSLLTRNIRNWQNYWRINIQPHLGNARLDRIAPTARNKAYFEVRNPRNPFPNTPNLERIRQRVRNQRSMAAYNADRDAHRSDAETRDRLDMPPVNRNNTPTP